MGLLTSLNLFIKSTYAKADEVNENFDDILTVINGNLNDDNIVALANIAQSKIDNDTKAIIAKSICDITDNSVEIQGVKHNNSNIGTGGPTSPVENCAVGLNSLGIFPAKALGIWGTDGDSDLIAGTIYKIAAGSKVVSPSSQQIDTGLSSIVAVSVAAYDLLTFAPRFSIYEGIIVIAATTNVTIHWIAIGT